MVSNTTYFRVRRDLFTDFSETLRTVAARPRVRITDEQFVVIRSFLTVRNDAISDDKRLSFDKAIMELRAAANDAIANFPHAHP